MEVKPIRKAERELATPRLFDSIDHFLIEQRLEPTPVNYNFAYTLLANPEGSLARAVAALTEGGVRLTQRDIESLGTAARPEAAPAPGSEMLVANAQLQLTGFADMVEAMHVETQDFGRNLVASADAIARSQAGDAGNAIDEFAHLTAAMIKRVQIAEARLETATREARELREQLDQATENSMRDPLTNLPNRRALEAAFRAEAVQGKRTCVAICDVDHFKSVNDRFGHAVGDRVLRAIAEVLAESCPDQLVARHGGEEFAILFRDGDLEAARARLDMARASVSAKRYRVRESALGEITISAGVVPANPEEMLATALHRADLELYKAKERGRNCVVASAEPAPASHRSRSS